jgi:hypothetical protein
MVSPLDQFQVIRIRKTRIDETFHQRAGFRHSASEKDSHSRLDMGQDLLGRNNKIFPLIFCVTAHFFIILLSFSGYFQ